MLLIFFKCFFNKISLHLPFNYIHEKLYYLLSTVPSDIFIIFATVYIIIF